MENALQIVAGLSEEQLEMRKSGIGASEIRDVLYDPLRLYLKKKGLADFEETEPMEWGNRLEEPIAQRYADKHKVELYKPKETLRHPTIAIAMCTPDRGVLRESWKSPPYSASVAITAGNPQNWERLLEVKNTNDRQADKWGEPGTDQINQIYVPQVIWQMGVTGHQETDVAVLIGGNQYREYTVRFDAELFEILVEEAQAFWNTYILTDTPPPLRGSKVASKYLEKKYPRHGNDLLRAGEQAEGLAMQLLAAQRTMKELEAHADNAKNELKALIGDKAGIQGDNWKVTWKQTKNTFDTNWKLLAEMAATRAGVSKDEWSKLVADMTEVKNGYRKFYSKFKTEEGDEK